MAQSLLFVAALPDELLLPEVGLDPDGEVSLEWFGRPGKRFSVSIGIDGTLTCAGLSQNQRVKSNAFMSGGIPPTIPVLRNQARSDAEI